MRLVRVELYRRRRGKDDLARRRIEFPVRDAEAVAREYEVTRDDQDAFAYSSHMKAIDAIKDGKFKDEIVAYDIEENYLDESEKKQVRKFTVDTDEGPRHDTSPEKLSTLKPVFDAKGTVTAGNSSQTSDVIRP